MRPEAPRALEPDFWRAPSAHNRLRLLSLVRAGRPVAATPRSDRRAGPAGRQLSERMS